MYSQGLLISSFVSYCERERERQRRHERAGRDGENEGTDKNFVTNRKHSLALVSIVNQACVSFYFSILEASTRKGRSFKRSI